MEKMRNKEEIMVKINESQIKKIAKALSNIEIKIPNFTESIFFPVIARNFKEHENIINFFFATTVLNFGFWKYNHNGYNGAIYEIIDGKNLKGSEILYRKAIKMYDNNEFFAPQFIKNHWSKLKLEFNYLMPNELTKHDIKLRMNLLKNYAESFKYSPFEILEAVNQSFNPLEEFRIYMQSITGYKEDPLGKKIELLGLFLACRPEKFLKVDIKNRSWKPIIDYHWMRFGLRTGMITVDKKIEEILKYRRWIDKNNHDRIRLATYKMNKILKDYSFKSIVELDQYIWDFMRKNCEEDPKCQSCIFQDCCKKRRDLFQPIYKTIYY